MVCGRPWPPMTRCCALRLRRTGAACSSTPVMVGAPRSRHPDPRSMPRRNVYLTASQLDKLADESARYRSLVLLLGVGGLRWGEAAALRIG
jgi:integrase